ncbi:prolyl oligopeptidase family protein [Aliikangiella sp. G2MR2-5]|uniref:prolyl oligopeptidase family serine peptidase n=1 Tax=Aliikangiella sp. G2MR2-5 TaxID=2788943 RepID=UPI0018A9C6B4|nr:prolyl oligopeptidase family serine peptidase [Aliikangiella sp. G2MR2-5]
MFDKKWTAGLVIFAAQAVSAAKLDDPYLWLEEVHGEKAMEWVKSQNAVSERDLSASKYYQAIKSDALDILNSKDKIKYVSIRGDKVYNFWRDAKNVRGLYREANLKDYLANKPKWETVLDIDLLGKNEKENWVYKGINCLFPRYESCLVSLSRGGADATVTREFNIKSRSFVKDGFFLPEAKSEVSWKDENTIYVGTNFGEGSLTSSGYPRISKLWKRGTPLSEAKTVYEGKVESVSAGAYRSFSIHGNYDIVYEATSFYTGESFLLEGDKKIKLVKPDSAELAGLYNNNLFVSLKSDWTYEGNKFKQGAVIYASMDSVKKGKPDYRVFIEPTKEKIIDGIRFSENYIWVSWLDNVKSVVERMSLDSKGQWQSARLPMDSKGDISLFGMQEDSDAFFVSYSSFLQSDTLYYMDGKTFELTELQKLPSWFDADKYKVEQNFATSKDGTRIPYFLVMNKGAKLDGKNPTLLYGYGGFEVSMRPYYSALRGKAWLENGGVYVLANIRGGGEFGPAWHHAALKENRQRAYEDFEAIAKDLIKRKITSPAHLGAMGGSNGGLLMGNMITRSPELFNAIVCQVPLLDMKRYNKLLAGASWMAEYGNPDVAEEWDYIKEFSPYHNLSKDKSYPKVFFTTSTRDDRVHPAHARKMVAKMKGLGHDVFYYENIEGGHGGAADNNQVAHLYAMVYSYLFEQLN